MQDTPKTQEGIGQIREEITYLRVRTDKLSEEILDLTKAVHEGRKTDWPAISAIIVVIVTVGSLIGGLVMGSITEKFNTEDKAVAKLEERADNFPAQMEAIAKDKVNELVKQYNTRELHK